MGNTPQKRGRPKQIGHSEMTKELNIYWSFNSPFQRTALRSETDMTPGWPTTYPLVVAINFARRTIEVGYAWQLPSDWPIGSDSPVEIYFFARDAVRPDSEDDVVASYPAAEWQSRLLDVLEVINEELKTVEITDALKNKIQHYFIRYHNVTFHSHRGQFNLFALERNSEIVGYYIAGRGRARSRGWGPDELSSALSTLKALPEGEDLKTVRDSISA